MSLSLNRASRLGFYGGLIGVAIIFCLWGFVSFGNVYDGKGETGRLATQTLIGLLPCLVGLASVLVPLNKPLILGVVLLTGAVLGFGVLLILWLPPGILMLMGAYRSIKAISGPEILIESKPLNLRPVIGWMVVIVFIGLMAFGIAALMGPRVGSVFSGVGTPKSGYSTTVSPRANTKP